jgi:hypothetical protein
MKKNEIHQIVNKNSLSNFLKLNELPNDVEINYTYSWNDTKDNDLNQKSELKKLDEHDSFINYILNHCDDFDKIIEECKKCLKHIVSSKLNIVIAFFERTKASSDIKTVSSDIKVNMQMVTNDKDIKRKKVLKPKKEALATIESNVLNNELPSQPEKKNRRKDSPVKSEAQNNELIPQQVKKETRVDSKRKSQKNESPADKDQLTKEEKVLKVKKPSAISNAQSSKLLKQPVQKKTIVESPEKAEKVKSRADKGQLTKEEKALKVKKPSSNAQNCKLLAEPVQTKNIVESPAKAEKGKSRADKDQLTKEEKVLKVKKPSGTSDAQNNKLLAEPVQTKTIVESPAKAKEVKKKAKINSFFVPEKNKTIFPSDKVDKNNELLPQPIQKTTREEASNVDSPVKIKQITSNRQKVESPDKDQCDASTKVVKKLVKKPLPKKETTIASETTRLKCQFCEKDYINQKTRKAHVNLKHPGETCI